MEAIELNVNGKNVSIPLNVSRRRYGNTTYTWVSARSLCGKWVELGDPWPAIKPKKSEILLAIQSRIESKEILI
jgi:hypothetical protein